MSHVVLAVDFGTFNTVAVLARPGLAAEPLLFDGSPILPSAVLATGGGRFLVGRDAQRAVAADPACCEPNPKRRIDDASVLLGEHEYPTGALIAAVFARVIDVARQTAGRDPDEVVLTHPAGWGNTRREVLVNAARASGLSMAPRLLAEPVAAAHRFLDNDGATLAEGGRALVYDLGAGTCDLTLLARRGGRVEVDAVDGMNDVGGLDVDHVIVEHLRGRHPDAEAWSRLSAPATAGDRRQRRLLWEDVRSAKELLSRETQASIHIPLLNVDTHLTRPELDDLVRPLVRPTAALAGDLVRGAGAVSVSHVYLTGGASRMPLVATELLRQLGIAATLTEQPELVIATGAARSAAPAAPVSPPAFAPPPPHSTPPMTPPPPPVSGSDNDSKAPASLRRRTFLFGGLAAASAAAAGTAAYLLWPSGPYTVTARDEVTALAFSPDGTKLGIGCDGSLQLWDFDAEKITTLVDKDKIAAVAFSSDGKRMASSWESTALIYVWDVATGKRRQKIDSGAPSLALAYIPGSTTFSDGNKFYPVDKTKGEAFIRELSAAVAFNADGGMATALSSGLILINSDADGKQKTVAEDSMVSVAFGPAGKTIAAAPEDPDVGVNIFDTAAPKTIHTLTKDETHSLAFDVENNRIATAGEGGVRLWDADRGRLLETLVKETVRRVAFSPDGSTLAFGGFTTGSSPKAIRIWPL